MAYPDAWPPEQSSGRRSLRFFISGTATVSWADRAYMFADQTGATNTTVTPVVVPGTHDTVNFPNTPMGSLAWCGNIKLCNDGTGADLVFTFDGTNIHGVLKKGEQVIYRDRWESGIAVRGASVPYRIECW